MRSFEEELAQLTNLITLMGGLTEAQFQAALNALRSRDDDLAGRTVSGDAKVDDVERRINHFTVRLLALRQPVAQDLRHIMGALRISADLERIADCAANIGERARLLNVLPPVAPVVGVPRLGTAVQGMLTDVLDAYVERNLEKALQVHQRDEKIDEMYNSLVRDLTTHMMENRLAIGPCTQLLLIAKNIERVGDHATNIAESIWFLLRGTALNRRHSTDEEPL